MTTTNTKTHEVTEYNGNKKPKFEVMTRSRADLTYGIWNNDMEAFQYVYDWNGLEVIDLEEANRVCRILNNPEPLPQVYPTIQIDKSEAEQFIMFIESDIRFAMGSDLPGIKARIQVLRVHLMNAKKLFGFPLTIDEQKLMGVCPKD